MDRITLYRVMTRVRRGEAGAATSEYAGMIVAVVVLVLSLAVGMTPTGRSLALGIGSQICKIFGMACGEDAPVGENPQTAADPRRPQECMVSSHQDSSSAYVKIGFIKIGTSFGFVTQEEQYYDPETGEVRTRYNVIATDGGSLAGEVGIGTKGEVGNSGLGADLSYEAGFDVRSGDTWTFDSEADMNAFVDQYHEYRMQSQSLASEGGAGYALFLWMTDGFVEPPRTADKRAITLKVEPLNANGDAGLRVGKDNDQTGENSVNLNVGLYAHADASQSFTRTNDLRPGHEGEYSETVTYAGSIEGGVNAVFAGVGGTGTYEGGTTYTYKPGPDGKPVLTGVTFSQVTSGDLSWKFGNGPVNQVGDVSGTGSASPTDKQSHVTETTIEVTDENRAIVEKWREESLVVGPDGTTTMLLPPNILDPSTPYPSDPMAQLLYEEATSTDTTYNVSGDNFSLGGEVALGLKLGGGFSISNEDQSVADSTYLGSPSAPGAQRQREDNMVCK